jgi:hypothetical protein
LGIPFGNKIKVQGSDFMKQHEYPDLKSMRDVNINHIDLHSLPDKRDVDINTTTTVVLERMLDYIDKAKNPYFLRSDETLVKIEYVETETTIEDCIESYFRSLMLNHSIDIQNI